MRQLGPSSSANFMAATTFSPVDAPQNTPASLARRRHIRNASTWSITLISQTRARSKKGGSKPTPMPSTLCGPPLPLVSIGAECHERTSRCGAPCATRQSAMAEPENLDPYRGCRHRCGSRNGAQPLIRCDARRVWWLLHLYGYYASPQGMGHRKEQPGWQSFYRTNVRPPNQRYRARFRLTICPLVRQRYRPGPSNLPPLLSSSLHPHEGNRCRKIDFGCQRPVSQSTY